MHMGFTQKKYNFPKYILPNLVISVSKTIYQSYVVMGRYFKLKKTSRFLRNKMSLMQGLRKSPQFSCKYCSAILSALFKSQVPEFQNQDVSQTVLVTVCFLKNVHNSCLELLYETPAIQFQAYRHTIQHRHTCFKHGKLL